MGLAYGCRNNVAILDKFAVNGVSVSRNCMDFKKQAFPSRVFTLKSVYEKQSMQIQEFFKILQYLVATYSIDIIAGECNYYLLKVLENNLLDIFTDHVQMVNKSTHVSGYLVEHVYIKKSLLEERFT